MQINLKLFNFRSLQEASEKYRKNVARLSSGHEASLMFLASSVTNILRGKFDSFMKPCRETWQKVKSSGAKMKQSEHDQALCAWLSDLHKKTKEACSAFKELNTNINQKGSTKPDDVLQCKVQINDVHKRVKNMNPNVSTEMGPDTSQNMGSSGLKQLMKTLTSKIFTSSDEKNAQKVKEFYDKLDNILALAFEELENIHKEAKNLLSGVEIRDAFPNKILQQHKKFCEFAETLKFEINCLTPKPQRAKKETQKRDELDKFRTMKNQAYYQMDQHVILMTETYHNLQDARKSHNAKMDDIRKVLEFNAIPT